MSDYQPISLSSGENHSVYKSDSPVERESDGLHLFVSNPRVVDLPEQGCITFRFKRGPLTIKEGYKGSPGSASADLTLLEICDVKDEESPEVKESKDTIDEIFNSIRDESSAPAEEVEG